MRILGIDPGLIATGYGVVEVDPAGEMTCLAAGVIRPEQDDLSVRLLHIHTQVTKLLHEFIPDALAIEDLFTNYEFPKTAILMGHARGVVFLAATQRAVPVINYASTKMKRAVTGHGHASKAQVASMVQRLLRLPNTALPDHVTDALGLAICHAYREMKPALGRR